LPAAGLEPGAPFVVLAPGAAYGSAKQWLPERFAELGARVVRDLGWHVVLVGSRADAPVCGEIGSRLSALGSRLPSPGSRLPSVVNLAGRTSLAELAALLSRSRAVVANDSGAMHLAGAVGARVVAVFGSTNEHRTAPLTQGDAAPAPVILTHDAFCRPCMLRECPIDHRCMRGVSADRVFQSLEPRA
jgi:heptosyltransferase-2